MSAQVASVLREWHEFYLLLGTAAAAVVALLFVAASVGAGLLTPERSAGVRVFMTPVVVHFATVLGASLLLLMPSHTLLPLGALLALNALGGGIYAVVIGVRVWKNAAVDLSDRIGYGLAPILGHIGAFGAAVLLLLGHEAGFDVLAVALVLLLVAGIRNAWDLAVFMVRKHSDRRA
jgi:hypothetical protein